MTTGRPRLLQGGTRTSRPGTGVLAVALIVGALASGCAAGTASSPTAPASSAGLHGDEPDPLRTRASFVLQDTSGARYDFAEQTHGRPTLLYFGYTNCPDECPTAMADVAAALRQVPADLRRQTAVVFVTTDPERDEPALLRRWLDMFSTEAVGLTGTPEQVAVAQQAMGLSPAGKGGPVETVPGTPDEHVHAPGTAPHSHLGPLGYGVEHTDVLFAFDAADHLRVRYPGGTRPSDLAADLPVLAQGDAS